MKKEIMFNLKNSHPLIARAIEDLWAANTAINNKAVEISHNINELVGIPPEEKKAKRAGKKAGRPPGSKNKAEAPPEASASGIPY